MVKDLSVIPECFVDTNLISCLLGGIGVNHQKGCTRVTGVMEKLLSDRFAIGVIDADKVTPGYLANFRKVAGLQHISVYKSDMKETGNTIAGLKDGNTFNGFAVSVAIFF